MTALKTILMTAAMLAVPAAAFAQSSATSAKDYAKDKAVETAVDAVMDNATTEDAMVAGTTMIKGGSKEDAAIAVMQNRVDGKVDSMTDGVKSMDGMSKDAVMDKAAGSATTYTEGATDAAGSAKTYTGNAASSAATYGSPVMPKSGVMSDTRAPAMTAPVPSAMTPLNCPSGTKGMPDGTCMVTGNWNPS